jgi:hypothetical protein
MVGIGEGNMYFKYFHFCNIMDTLGGVMNLGRAPVPRHSGKKPMESDHSKQQQIQYPSG